MKTRLFLLFALAVSAAFAVPTFPPPCPVPEPATPPEYIKRADLIAFLQVNAANAQKWAEICRENDNEDMAKQLDGVSIADDYLAVMLADPAGTWVNQFDEPPVPEVAPEPVTTPEPPEVSAPEIPDCDLPPASEPATDETPTPEISPDMPSDDSPEIASPPRSTIVILPSDDYGTDDSTDEENDGTNDVSDTSGDEGTNG